MFAWDDISVFLALRRERTTTRAAAVLGCSQPTVVRRLAALERAIGLTLFERSPSGLVPTAAAGQLLPAAEQVERCVCAFRAEVDLLTGAGADVIRLTLLDHFELLLVPVLRTFGEQWPGVDVELLASDRLYDLARGEADIAVRGRHLPNEDDVLARDLPPVGWTLYASTHREPCRLPASPSEVPGHRLAVLEGPPAQHLPAYRWLREQVRGESGSIRCSSFGALRSTIASGTALSILPCTVGDTDPGLVRCFPPPAEFRVPIYLLARRASLRRPPVRELFEAMHRFFTDNPVVLTGERE
ncbi:LysR family transcriptional regulator [Sphingomonas arenae]|uniref:LysR family transcriptional regulator n=1 Tax=Sphingomonas arenae TaxID=2812555 RepID=UPI001967559E|nr:LysR family transcriptional regulator [Sphingomonas arenae]